MISPFEGDIFPPNVDVKNPIEKGDYSLEIDVPKGYRLLLSLVHFDFINVTNNDQMLWILTDHSSKMYDHFQKFKMPLAYTTKKLKVIYSYSTYSDIVSTGFILRFSFLLRDQLPIRSSIDYNAIDCTQPNYRFYKEHVQCNLRKQCDGNEDEKYCDFTSHHCQGDISLNQSCFAIVDGVSITIISQQKFKTLKQIKFCLLLR